MLLDTCALVWIATGSKNLSHPTREAIEEAESVYVSSISAFEISFIYTKGGLELPCDPERWFYEILEKHDIIEIELNGKIAIASTKLPICSSGVSPGKRKFGSEKSTSFMLLAEQMPTRVAPSSCAIFFI